ncbi:hypothetical protein BD410DRAFT_808764 [Rickenella mellea]|uniref:Uncharacterized protein n=1 Tax=Rickenella mellea TaxID=50990 RepID=A0A4Y7PJG5_9AGAM|nr:hypothetical protein BD410DRAFT_808764 [Rickenella mellea]
MAQDYYSAVGVKNDERRAGEEATKLIKELGFTSRSNASDYSVLCVEWYNSNATQYHRAVTFAPKCTPPKSMTGNDCPRKMVWMDMLIPNKTRMSIMGYVITSDYAVFEVDFKHCYAGELKSDMGCTERCDVVFKELERSGKFKEFKYFRNSEECAVWVPGPQEE